jgi:hypothetical protein
MAAPEYDTLSSGREAVVAMIAEKAAGRIGGRSLPAADIAT